MYVDKCPKCGSSNIDSYGEWDIVTDQECGDCGWERCYGHVAGFPGSQYLVKYESEPDFGFDCDDEEDIYWNQDFTESHNKQLQAVTGYIDYEESDDLPF